MTALKVAPQDPAWAQLAGGRRRRSGGLCGAWVVRGELRSHPGGVWDPWDACAQRTRGALFLGSGLV